MLNSLRYATADDAERLHQLIVDLAIFEKEPDAVELSVEQLKEQLSDSRSVFKAIVAECIDESSHSKASLIIVGFALFFYNYSTWKGKKGLYLEDLFVLEQFRGKGIGKALMYRLATIAKEEDCARFEWSVLKWNQSAISFYEHLDAVRMDDWVGYRLDENGILKFLNTCF
ncbi:MAG: GNAT family N-acetyltransferase [Proteobacteria bacterium]|nr:GNAT family N-acetyltransferase [Pseudomonadota bacterium]